MTKNRKCINCGKPATRRLTPDLDIEGIPLCDNDRCKLEVVIKHLESVINKQSNLIERN